MEEDTQVLNGWNTWAAQAGFEDAMDIVNRLGGADTLSLDQKKACLEIWKKQLLVTVEKASEVLDTVLVL